MTDDPRLPPHSIEAERSLLGGLMREPRRVDEVADRLRVEHFYRRDHALVYEAILVCNAANRPADSVTVSEVLEKCGTLDEAGGMTAVDRLAKDTPSAANVRAYADIIIERAQGRDLIAYGTDLQEAVYSGRPLEEVKAEAQQRILDVGAETSGGPEPISAALPALLDDFDWRFNHPDELRGLPTATPDIDKRTSGYGRGHLVVVAARPGMGKTSYAACVARRTLEKTPVAFFSLEQPRQELLERMIAAEGRIDNTRLRDGTLNTDEWDRITAATARIQKLPLYVDETAGLRVGDLAARARRLKKRYGIGMVIVDYLQLMRVGGKVENRTQEISEISRSLKALAKDLDLPVIALSQLNRNVEQRPNKRPQPSDVRESGTIEQDADVLQFLYRHSEYYPEFEPADVVEVSTAKNRHGPNGRNHISWIATQFRFEDAYPPIVGDYQRALDDRPAPKKRGKEDDPRGF